MESQIQENRLVSDLSERRLIQYIGAYIALAFGIVQFAMLAEQRYGWSSSLVDKLVLLFVLLLPAVVVFTYNHGKPGHDAWKPFEKVFIPANIAVALISSILYFNNAAPKAETITLVDESGVEEQHVVPSQEYSSRITILPFNRSENIDLIESQILSYLTYLDMEQDSRLSLNNLFQLKESLLSYDLDYTKEITQSKALQIARDQLSDYYIIADVDRLDGIVSFSPKVYNTNTGKMFYEAIYTGESIYDLVDSFTAELNQKIYPEEDSQFSFTNSPANEIISANDEVVKIYVQNLYSTTLNPQSSPIALQSITKAVELDESCALCYEQFAGIQATLGIDGYTNTYVEALKHADALPEKLQYRIRVINYMVKGERDKSVKVAERWSALFPFDIEAYDFLIRHHMGGFRFDQAIEIMKAAINKGHKSKLLQLANLQITKEQYEEAMESISEYKKVFPHKAAELLAIGDIYIQQGKIQEGIDFFENILVSDPTNSTASLKTANAYSRLGKSEKEIDILNEALEFSKSPLDSVVIMDGFKANYLRMGDEEKFMSLVNAQNELNKSNFPPSVAIMYDINANTLNYVRFDNLQHVEDLFASAIDISDSSQKPTIECFRDFNIGFHTGNKTRLEKSMSQCGEMLKAVLGKGGEHQIAGVRAGMNGDNDGAIESFKTFANESGGNYNLLWQLVIDYYVKAERYDEGIALLDKTLLSNPENPVALYYRALCGSKLNQIDEAKKYLTKALATWEGASPKYRYYKEATDLAKEISL